MLQRRIFHCTTMYSEEYWVRICGENHQHEEVVGKRLVPDCSLSRHGPIGRIAGLARPSVCLPVCLSRIGS